MLAERLLYHREKGLLARLHALILLALLFLSLFWRRHSNIPEDKNGENLDVWIMSMPKWRSQYLVLNEASRRTQQTRLPIDSKISTAANFASPLQIQIVPHFLVTEV